jgi:phage/plasmid-associated DNA primase
VPDLKSRAELAVAAERLSQSIDLVQRANVTYIPVDWQTLLHDPPPVAGARIWLPLSREDKRVLANVKSNVLFASDSELRNFEFMLKQFAAQDDGEVHSILIKTDLGLKRLTRSGVLVDHDDSFTPNYIRPMLNEDPADKKEVWDVLVEWLDSEEQAHSLLHHLATSLSPSYSAVKYIILIGEGRNGKGVLLDMLVHLFGNENVSNITRQMMANSMPACVELNDKLLNVVFDGEMAYIKDSAMEKTLVAGEPGFVKLLYESGTTRVQTNALFIEALNIEPKVRDKSTALQKRLVRFQFPKVYAVDYDFHDRMVSEKMLGAFLALLIDHYVPKSQIAQKLALTDASMQLQLEQVWLGSPVLQYLETLDDSSLSKLEAGKMEVDTFMASFKPWAESQGIERSDGDLITLLNTSFNIRRKSLRKPASGKPGQRRVIESLKPETILAIKEMKGEDDGTTGVPEELV